MDKLINCTRCGQKSMSIDDSLLCGGCRQENPYLMGASDAPPEPDTIESLHEAACKLTEMLDSAESELTAANARVAELKRVNAIMDEELRTKTQALFNLESENKVLKDIDAHRQPHFESLQQEYYAERDRRMKLEEALGQLHDSASEYAADQSGANDPRCGVVQPISVADGEALNDALRRAAALLEKK